jgi:hypothetical protein
MGAKAAKLLALEWSGLDPPPATTESIEYQGGTLEHHGIFKIGRP